MELLGILLVAAIPSVMIAGVLVPIIGNRGRAAMWKAAAILIAMPIAWAIVWAIWANLDASGSGVASHLGASAAVFIPLLLPILVIAGVLHYANFENWSTLVAGLLAVCAGTAMFTLVMIWMLQHVVMGAY